MSGCGARCGIQQTRAREREEAIGLARQILVEPPAIDGRPLRALESLRQALEAALPVRAVREPDDSVLALHCVATTEESTWLERRAGLGPRPLAAQQSALRVLLSPYGTYAALQEVRFTATPEEGGEWVEEQRLAGVEDRRMQHLVRGAQGLLRREGLTLLDVALLVEPEGPTTLWQLLMERDPPATTVGTFVADEVRGSGDHRCSVQRST